MSEIEGVEFESASGAERSIEYQIDCDEIIESVALHLKGQIKVFNKKTQKMEVINDPHSKPLINEKGVSRVITILRSHINKVFILSDLEDEDIRAITSSLSSILIDELYFNWEEFGITSYPSGSIVIDVVVNTVYATLRKAYRGGYLDAIKTIQRIHDVQTVSTSDRTNDKGGIGGLMSSFRR